MTNAMTPTRTRTIEEVFQSHREAIENLDMPKLAADYAEDAVLMTMDGAFEGREAILTGFFQTILAQFPDMKINFEGTAFHGDTCIVQWSAEASAATVPAGVGVLSIRDGLIRSQVEWFQLVLK